MLISRLLLTRRLELRHVQELALERGGLCLSERYINKFTSLQWRCSKGHEWPATLHSVKYNRTWCPICSRLSLSIEDALNAAALRGGTCLSHAYVNSSSPLNWQCAKGHQWSASLSSIRRGTWCPVCVGCAPHSLETAHQEAARRGGSCLSTAYKNAFQKMVWRCSQGHVWEACLNSVKNRGSWCPTCFGNAPLNLEIAKQEAVARGGVCLSSTYINSITPLSWRCSQGHEWEDILRNVRSQNVWCSRCSPRKKSEKRVKDIFETIFRGYEFHTCRPAFLRGNSRRPLELDGYCSALNLAFEYNGAQHYDEHHFFHRSCGDSFASQVERDRWKVMQCKRLGVRLVVIPYMIRDYWSFIRLSLLKWFSISELFPSALEA